jgi:uncharacterized protein (TIGR02145 family)
VSIKKALSRIWIALSVVATVAIGQTNPSGSVKIGNLTWTKQNVNIKTPDSWCYEDKDSNCAKYGRLYTYEAAKTACASMGGKWRLPTNEDWDSLIKATGGARKIDEYGDAYYDVAGKKLKSARGWNNNKDGASGNGTDEFGFLALPGGNRKYSDDSFSNAGYYGHWWSATEYGSGLAYYAYYWYMYYGYDGVGEGGYGKSNGISVRCVGGE